MPRHGLTEDQWERVRDLIPGRPGLHGKVARDNRLFLDAVLWIARTGAPWRDLPPELGNWNSTWRRFDRWCKKGVWQAVMDALRDDDLEWLILDSTTVRAHADAAGARGNKGGRRRTTRPSAAQVAGSGPSCTSSPTRWATRFGSR